MKLNDPPSILIENIWHEDAKNVYHARRMIQRHYKGETYQMQIDSHHRVAKDWDTKFIKMLHSCDAGEYSVISIYPLGFHSEDPKNGYSKAILYGGHFNVMRFY